jgi:hypothetical protein
LSNSTIYYYRVAATNGVGDSSWSNTASITTVPAAPSFFQVTTLLPSEIQLSWQDNSPDETSFKIYAGHEQKCDQKNRALRSSRCLEKRLELLERAARLYRPATRERPLLGRIPRYAGGGRR